MNSSTTVNAAKDACTKVAIVFWTFDESDQQGDSLRRLTAIDCVYVLIAVSPAKESNVLCVQFIQCINTSSHSTVRSRLLTANNGNRDEI